MFYYIELIKVQLNMFIYILNYKMYILIEIVYDMYYIYVLVKNKFYVWLEIQFSVQFCLIVVMFVYFLYC